MRNFIQIPDRPLSLLIGKCVRAIYKTDGGRHFGFETVDGENFAFEVDSPCCSTSWIENIDLLAKLPAIVQGVDDNADEKGLKGEGVERGRFIKIKTNRGYIDIDGRNDGGESGMYSFEYSMATTNTIYTMCVEKVCAEEDWAEFNKTAWNYAPGFNPKKWEGFSWWEWEEIK